MIGVARCGVVDRGAAVVDDQGFALPFKGRAGAEDHAAVKRSGVAKRQDRLTVQFALPNNPALAGAVIQLQIAELQFDPGGNWIGLYTSNGLTMTIGAR